MKRLLILFIVFLPWVAEAQVELSLEDCILLARSQSTEAKRAEYALKDAEFEYKLYRKSMLPQLSLSGSIPAFNRTISKLTMPDGSEAFVAQSTGNYSANLSLNQVIPFTGGNLYVTSGLQRLDVYMDKTTTSYLANMMNIGLTQPLIAYNTYKWQRKIEPVAYQKAKRTYVEALENTALETIGKFYAMLETQQRLLLKRQNKANSDTLLAIAEEKRALGKITEDELMDVQISNLNLVVEIRELEIELEHNRSTLLQHLGLSDTTSITLTIPEPVKVPSIDSEHALSEAVSNGTLELEHQRRLLEAQSEVARVRANNGFSVNLNGSFGLSKSGGTIGAAYSNPLNQEQITLTFTIPILEWGAAKCRRQQAEAALESEALAIEQEKRDFNEELRDNVRLYNLQAAQLDMMIRAIALSEKRYEMCRERYITGKISFLEFNNAQLEKDNAQISYLQTLQKNWQRYYQIRKLTLFDYETGKKVE